MTLQEALKKGQEYLEKQGIENAALDAWYMIEQICEIDRTYFLLNRQEQMSGPAYARYQTMLTDRGKHVPLQHLTGEQEFMGLTFKVSDKVLIPRQDTEVLVEEALKRMKTGMKVLDVCTGSGCIMISLIKLGDPIFATAVDISKEALEIAKENAKIHGVSIDFRKSDLFSEVDGSFQMIVSNPPYIPTSEIATLREEVRVFEPMEALDGREDGLYFYRKIISASREYLETEGWLIFEIGHDQGDRVSRLMADAGYNQVQVVKDLTGLDRVVLGRKE